MSSDQLGEGRVNGALIAERYEVGDLLGRGGMAEVRKGTDVRLGRVVAIKQLRTELADDPTFQARFRREAQSSAKLNHPAIVSVYDTGPDRAPDGPPGSPPYIVMEYVEGRTLRDILREGRKILPERASEITSEVLAALDYSHRSQQIVHRDIKPANVMLTPSGAVKVMDFGIARAMADTTSTMTQTAAVVGTAQYLSPEQARGESVDSRSDVYSTGCLFYELLVGRPPFVGDSPVAVAYQHVREQAAPPSALDEELPAELDAIVMKSLAKRVGDRYQSAGEMRADIERFLAGLPVSAPVLTDEEEDFVPAEGTGSSLATAEAFEGPRRGRRRWPIVVAVLAALAVVAVGIVVLPLLLSSGSSEVTVPQLSNLTRSQAETRLRQLGLRVGQVSTESSQDVARNRVISQDPRPTSTLAPRGTVDLTVSTGKPDVVVPYVIGEDRDTARAKIMDAGLTTRLIERQSDEPKNTVVATDPNPAESIASGTRVKIYYASGPKQVPDVTGLTERRARTKLDAAGFSVDTVYDSDTEATKGTVLKQSPAPSSRQPQGTTVVITVSLYEAPSSTPTQAPSSEPPPTTPSTPSSTPTPTTTAGPTSTPTPTPTGTPSPTSTPSGSPSATDTPSGSSPPTP